MQATIFCSDVHIIHIAQWTVHIPLFNVALVAVMVQFDHGVRHLPAQGCQFLSSNALHSALLMCIHIQSALGHLLQHFDGIADLIDLVGYCFLFVVLCHKNGCLVLPSLHLQGLIIEPHADAGRQQHVVELLFIHGVHYAGTDE